MTFTEAAAHVLRLVGKPLHYKEITDVAIEKNLLSHVGKSPEVTMGARLAALVKKTESDNPLIRVKPGVFALREWDNDTITKGLADRTPALERLAAAMAAAGEVLVDVARADEAAPAAHEVAVVAGAVEAPREMVVVGNEDDRRRAELAAGANDLFIAEEDDDKPIFGAGDEEQEEEEEKTADRGGRRRRRGGGGGSGSGSGSSGGKRGRNGDELVRGNDDLPGYTVSEPSTELLKVADAELRAREGRGGREARDGREPREARDGRERESRDRDRDRDRVAAADQTGRAQAPLDDLAGRDLADAVAVLLSSYDRNGGPVAFARLAEAAKRRGRLQADIQQGQALLEAAARADNLRRQAQGQRPRFRVSDRRVALTDWAADSELQRIERDLYNVVERYREQARRGLLRRIQELPQRSFGELALLLLERAGFADLQPVRRPGTHGAELHLSGRLQGTSGEVRTAVVLRRDGREIGRERVTELRGALHHYGPASAGWLITAGQVLSGAKEEANASGAAPVHLVDGMGLVRIMEEQGIGVSRMTLNLPVADFELLDALKSGG